ncbi:hypothetical protein AX16_001365 [Volvariella volvacea WC 439]|nr:hypothetical protein AX16_001365 [Volvariella volvacea WC 439]
MRLDLPIGSPWQQPIFIHKDLEWPLPSTLLHFFSPPLNASHRALPASPIMDIDMDTNWCLTCDRHFEGDGPYCSLSCENIAINQQPSTSRSHLHYSSPSEEEDGDELDWVDCDEFDEDEHLVVEAAAKAPWVGNGTEGIRAWAETVPLGAPVDDDTTPNGTPSSALCRPPRLLIPQRPVPPSLCMSTPQPAKPQPSQPILTPQQQYATLSMNQSVDAVSSMGKISLHSAASESTLATPISSHSVPISSSVLGNIASRMASWVAPSVHLGPDSPHFQRSPRVPKEELPASDEFCKDKNAPLWWASSTTIVESPIKAMVKKSQEPSKHCYFEGTPIPSMRGRKPSRVAA